MGRHSRAPAPNVFNTMPVQRRSVIAVAASATTVAVLLTIATAVVPRSEDVPSVLAAPGSSDISVLPSSSATTAPATTTQSAVPSTSSAPVEKDAPVAPSDSTPDTAEEVVRDEAEPTTVRPTPPATTPPPVIAAPTAGPACGTSGFNGVVDHVAQVGFHLRTRFGLSLSGILGVGGRANASDHPRGLALDFLVNRAQGDELAAYVLANRRAFAVTYVIWRQRINYGAGWEGMPDRGSATANHYDHVHVSFASDASGDAITC